MVPIEPHGHYLFESAVTIHEHRWRWANANLVNILQGEVTLQLLLERAVGARVQG